MRKLIGILVILAGLCLLAVGGYVFVQNEERESAMRRSAEEILELSKTTAVEPKEFDLPIKVINGVEYIGTLHLPSMNIDLPIQAECRVELLDLAPGRLHGTPYENNLVLGGHNAKSHFQCINNLIPGDDIIFEDYAGNFWNYKVVSMETLYPSQYDKLTESDYDLSLFNCTWDNTKRYVVRCNQSQ